MHFDSLYPQVYVETKVFLRIQVFVVSVRIRSTYFGQKDRNKLIDELDSNYLKLYKKGNKVLDLFDRRLLAIRVRFLHSIIRAV